MNSANETVADPPAKPLLHAKVLTVSDGVIHGTREDRSGVALVEQLTAAGDGIEEDPGRLAELRERRHLLRELRRKYGETQRNCQRTTPTLPAVTSLQTPFIVQTTESTM